MSIQCGVVEPFWIQFGWIKWEGQRSCSQVPEKKEPRYMLQYKRCTCLETSEILVDGLIRNRCSNHIILNPKKNEEKSQ